MQTALNALNLFCFRKNPKDVKSTTPKSVEKKIDVQKATNTAKDLPPIQSKEVLLLNHDYGRAFAKRKVESNWDRYEELPDDDDDNPQMMAADFDKILLAPKSIGEHFTFASERAWQQDVDADAESSTDKQCTDLFKLNLSNLKNGVGRLPFYLRNDLPLDLFDNDEITDMNFRANYYDSEKQKPQTKSTGDVVSMPTILGAKEHAQSNEVRLPEYSVATTSEKTNVKLSESIINLAESTASLTIEKSSPQHSTTPTSMETPKGSNKNENIQDWLDDILNE